MESAFISRLASLQRRPCTVDALELEGAGAGAACGADRAGGADCIGRDSKEGDLAGAADAAGAE